MDTGLGRDGYSIIGQGRIAEIVSGKSNERREIFEEAAGISRYRYRKEESERKLARTEENLLRINDKVDELELQVEPLRKQAETAKKYLRLRDELKSAEVSVWMETLDRLHAQAETVNRDYQTAKENLAGAQRELEQLYAVSENIAQKMREKDLESERTREQISEAESAAAECESAAAVVRTNLQNSADSIARLRVEVSEQTDRADALQAQIEAQQRRLQEIEAEKAQHAQEIQSVLAEIDRNAASSGEAERAYTELLAKESAQSSALAECRTRITLLADKSQELLDQENAVATAAAEAAEHLAALETQQQEKQTAQQQARTACDALRAEQREKAQRLSACEQALTRQQERLSGLTVDLRSTESRIRMLMEMEKDFEGYNRAVKAVMHAAEKGTLRGVRGPVANLIKTGDRYALAIETALGAAAQNIVVDTQSCGAQAIELLRRRETGRATFLPLDTIRPMHLNSVPDQEPGYVGVADTLVTCAAAYRNIVSNLLGRTVVAETMKDAIAISRRYDHRYRIVTLDGQLVNAGGSLTGGSAAKGSGILSRANELKRLRAALDTLTLEKKQCEAELEDAQTALDAAHAQLDTVQAQLEQAVETLHKAESEAAQVALLKNAAQETIAGQNASIDACRAQQKANQDRIAAARADALSAEQALAALRAVEAGYQAALMAPTEILAEQHFKKLVDWLTPLGIRTAWLTGRLKASEKRRALEEIASGEARIVVGTHALIQETVTFEKLGLAIVDEQHRFGVAQRLALRTNGAVCEPGDAHGANDAKPHLLMLSATPIPRTLAMSYLADLDVSVIDELPPGRTPVTTKTIRIERKNEVVALLRSVVAEGRQAYWVCPLIEESEALDLTPAVQAAEELQRALPDLKVALLHGAMTAPEKEVVMSAFASGETDLLVATTVIEVGVDVPNATLMVIEHAERFGLAQLHQLRGRVGRGAARSACLLLYGGELSELGRERLKIIRETTDGFEIARRDLQLRGPGEFLGERQSGMPLLRFADLETDGALLEAARREAERWLREDRDRALAHARRWFSAKAEFLAA